MNPRTGGFLAAVAAVAAAIAAATPVAQPPPASPSPTTPSGRGAAAIDERRRIDSGAAEEERAVRQACTGCHALPPPDILPREDWTAKIYEMVGLMIAGIGAPATARATIPTDFDVDAVERYYRTRAPVTLPTPVPWPPAGEGSPRFVRHVLKLAGGDSRPAIANVRFLDLDGSGELHVVAVDMTHGLVMRGSATAPDRGLSIVERVTAPCHTAVVDLDRDGRRDLLIADLGAVAPSDHLRGSVVWLQGSATGRYRKHTLASGLPRVADVEAADFDGDGDLDVVVAAFGWRKVGSLLLLENRTEEWSVPSFVPRELDPRTGSINVPALDLDRDGRPDVVTVFSQHFESVVAFLNGRGGWRPQSIYTAPHPGWGSSGIDVADLDRDGDLDVILSHGDMLDDFLLKPYHGIQWLENRGAFPFTEHTLAAFSGAMGAKVVDLDGDGDLDVVAAAFVPPPRRGQPVPPPLPSLVWLEQLSPGRFERRTLEVGGRHVSVDAADPDHDGDVDLVVGSFMSETENWVEVWENLSAKK